MVVRFLKRFVRELIRSAQVLGALSVGMTPEVLDERTAPRAPGEQPKAPEPPPPPSDGLPPGPGHPERPVPHVPPTAEERSLWARLR